MHAKRSQARLPPGASKLGKGHVHKCNMQLRDAAPARGQKHDGIRIPFGRRNCLAVAIIIELKCGKTNGSPERHPTAPPVCQHSPECKAVERMYHVPFGMYTTSTDEQPHACSTAYAGRGSPLQTLGGIGPEWHLLSPLKQSVQILWRLESVVVFPAP